MKQAILGIIRHILTTAGGGLVASGTVNASEANTLTGAAVILVGLGWSIFEKRSR